MIDDRLIQTLIQCNQQFTPSPKRDANIAALADSKAAAIITGQQVGLYLSPLLVLYKALAAVKAAQTAKSPTVPIFWLQSEDHDFNEIRSAQVLNSTGVPLQLSLAEQESRVSVQEYLLPVEIEPLNARLEELLGFLPHGTETLALVRRHYQTNQSIVDAFAGMLAELTAEYGLIFFNPRAPAASELAKPIYQKALERYEEIAAVLLQQGREIVAAGATPQVHVRERSPLFFLHSSSKNGSRHRLEWREDKKVFSVLGTTEELSLLELQEIIEQHPERCSSSALLRPIVQNSLFPTAGYIAGPAERQYFKQIQPLFELFSTKASNVLPRPQAVLIEPKAEALLQELNLKSSDLMQDEQQLLAQLAEVNADNWLSPQALQQEVSTKCAEVWKILSENVEKLDSTLEKPLEKTRSNVEGLFERFSDRYTKAAGTKDQVAHSRLERLRGMLYPDGQPQERSISLVYYLAKYGPAVIGTIFDAMQIPDESEDRVEFQEIAL